MANWNQPLLSDLKVDVLDMLKQRDLDSITLAETPTNPPVGAIRWNRSLSTFESWSGSAWVVLVLGIPSGGTGASDINGFLDNFNLGSMALQNNNAVAITGGYINGLSSASGWALQVSGNTALNGLVFAGSANIPITTSAGYVPQAAIEDSGNIANTHQNETITGTWNFSQPLTVAGSVNTPQVSVNAPMPQIWLNDTDEAANNKYCRIAQFGKQFTMNFYNDTLSNGSTFFYANRVDYATTAAGILATDINLTLTRLNVRSIGHPNEARINVHSGDAGAVKGLFLYNPNNADAAQFYAYNTTLYIKADLFHFQTLASGSLISFDAAGNSLQYGQARAQNIYSDTVCDANSFNSRGNEAYYAKGYSHVRIHIREESYPLNQKTYVFMNYAGNFSIVPTTDDGSSPVGSDWMYSLGIQRDGRVRIGAGGLEVTKIHNASHLMHGNWQPVDAGSLSGITAITYHYSHYIRVGTAVTVSGQLDASSAGVGVTCHARIFNPLYTMGSIPSSSPSGAESAGHGCITSHLGESGTCTCPPGAGHADIIWTSKDPGAHAFHFHYTYIAAS
jgi:hypothetical protein